MTWTKHEDGVQTARLRAPRLGQTFTVTLFPRTYTSVEQVAPTCSNRELFFEKYQRAHTFSISGEMSGTIFDTDADPDGTDAVFKYLQNYY